LIDAVLLGCLSGLLFGALAPAMRYGQMRTGDPELVAFHSCALALPVAVVIAAAAGGLGDIQIGQIWPFLIVGFFVPGISQVLFSRAIKDLGASRTVIVTGQAPLWASVIALVFLDEPFHPLLLGGALLVVAGALTLAWERERPASFRAVGLVWALAGVVMFAGRDVSARWLSAGGDAPGVNAAVALLLSATLSLALYLLARRGVRTGLAQIVGSARPNLVAGAVFGAGYCVLLEAFDRGKVTVVSPLNGTYAMWAVVFSALVMRKAEMINRRVVLAALFMVAGGAVVGITR
jgi:drug/metabolite transporter (DMT)-like permease